MTYTVRRRPGAPEVKYVVNGHGMHHESVGIGSAMSDLLLVLHRAASKHTG